MDPIQVEHQPSQETLQEKGVFSWPTWSKEVSTFPWTYGDRETCYILEGKVVVTPDGGDPVEIGPGDLVVFPAGMSCTWAISEPIKKHFDFG